MPVYKVLFSKQKTQKNKKWSDGFMRELQFGQLKLLDENKVEIDSDFKKPGTIQPGDTIEFDRYIVEVDCLDDTEIPEKSMHLVPSRPGHPLPAEGGNAAPTRSGCSGPTPRCAISTTSQLRPTGSSFPRPRNAEQSIGNEHDRSQGSEHRPLLQSRQSLSDPSEQLCWPGSAQEKNKKATTPSNAQPIRKAICRSPADILNLLGMPSTSEVQKTSNQQGAERSCWSSWAAQKGPDKHKGQKVLLNTQTGKLERGPVEDAPQHAIQDSKVGSENRGVGGSSERYVNQDCSSAFNELHWRTGVGQMKRSNGPSDQDDMETDSGERNSESAKGFLALKNHTAQGFSLALSDCRPANKRPKLLSPNPLAFNKTASAGEAKMTAGEGKTTRSGIVFPKASAADVSGPPASRQVMIPNVLTSPAMYKTVFTSALEEEISIKLAESASGLYRVLKEICGDQKGALVMCKCSPAKAPNCCIVSKEGANKNRPFFSCRLCNFFQWADEVKKGEPRENEAKVIDQSTPPNLAILRQRQQPVYSCQVITTDRRDFQQINARKKAGQLDAGSKREIRVCLKLTELNEKKQQVKLQGCHKDDIWVISSSAFFAECTSATTVIASSAWYGADGDGNIEIKPLQGQLSMLMNRNVCYAFKGPNIGAELDMLVNLKEFSPAAVPLLPAMLTGGTRSLSHAQPMLRTVPRKCIHMEQAALEAAIHAASSRHGLNAEQTQVLERVARSIVDAVILVQGVFGSGKSTLLVAIVLFLVALFKNSGVQAGAPEGRILISAATNVAVDNILLGLLDEGFYDFIRIGCLPKIAKPILTRTLKETVGNEDKVDAESLKDLNAMLMSTRDKQDLAQIRAAIAECRAGKMQEKKRALGETQVVGVTCASTRQETLAGQKFGILILDEMSQFIEPLSFLPIARFSCRVLIGAGDPKQLPPTLPGCEGSETNDRNDLSKTLFSRLANTGLEPVMLKRQYRCHPVLGTLASDLFYEGKLINGVTEQDRRALVEGWPPLLFFNSAGSREEHRNESCVNLHEAGFIVDLVARLLANGLDGSHIGVICLYKAQETLIRELLLTAMQTDAAAGCGSVKVSTVDAFQGGEKEIIFVSCCRTSSLGFTASPNRMNVAMTRARRHLAVVGDVNVLSRNVLWKQIIERATWLPGARHDMKQYKASNPNLYICPLAAEDLEQNGPEQIEKNDTPETTKRKERKEVEGEEQLPQENQSDRKRVGSFCLSSSESSSEEDEEQDDASEEDKEQGPEEQESNNTIDIGGEPGRIGSDPRKEACGQELPCKTDDNIFFQEQQENAAAHDSDSQAQMSGEGDQAKQDRTTSTLQLLQERSNCQTNTHIPLGSLPSGARAPRS